jgi:hypothetical protein
LLREATSARNPREAALLRECALLRAIDAPAFEHLRARPRPGEKGAAEDWPSFQWLIEQPDVAVSPGARQEFYVKDDPRRTLLDYWREHRDELRTFSQWMVQYYAARPGDPLDRLTHQVFAHPTNALRECRATYDAADARGDLVSCDALLRVLRNRKSLLSKAIRQFLEEQEVYLAGRQLFVEEWTRSSHYLERETLTRDVTTFLGNRNQWLLQIGAMGGLGKTAFLQWLIARRLVARTGDSSSLRRTPVARLDFDRVNRAVAATEPCLLLLSLAQQLDRQLSRGRTSTFQEFLDSYREKVHALQPGGSGSRVSLNDSERTEIEDVFCQQIGQDQVVLIFDTIEEMVFHRPAAWQRTLELLARVREKAPRIQVILAGRCVLPDQSLPALAVPPFSAKESLRYLCDLRGLEPAFDRKTADLPPESHPFKLALFADRIGRGGTFTRDDLSNLAHEDIEFLVRRILERLHDCELEWTLRYAVVPNRLTKEFLRDVLLPYLRKEAAKSDLDHPWEGLPAGGQVVKERGRWQRCDKPFDVDRIWPRLRTFASGANWISFDGDQPWLQPELVQPMRYLLQYQPVHAELHRTAAKYFEGQAEAAPDIAGPLLQEALYHHFQADGPAAADAWRRLLGSPLGQLPGVREQLASSLVGGNYVDDRKRPLRHAQKGTIIGVDTLAEAHFDLSSVSVRKTLESDELSDLVETARYHMSAVLQLERELGRQVIQPERRALVEAALLWQDGRSKEALAMLARVLGRVVWRKLKVPEYEVPLLVLNANILAGSSPKLADRIYGRAARIAAKTPSPYVTWTWIRARQGRLQFDQGRFDVAEAHYADVVRRLLVTREQPAFLLACLGDLLEMLHREARWSEVDRWLTEATEKLKDHEPAAPFLYEQWARLSLALLRLERSFAPRTDNAVGLRLEAGRLALLLERSGRQMFDAATARFESARDTISAQACQIDKLELLLREFGDITSARSVASSLEPSGPNWLRAQLVLIELITRQSKSRAQERWS